MIIIIFLLLRIRDGLVNIFQNSNFTDTLIYLDAAKNHRKVLT